MLRDEQGGSLSTLASRDDHFARIARSAISWPGFCINFALRGALMQNSVEQGRETPKKISIWFSQDVCLGKYKKRMGWLRSERNSCRLACECRIPVLLFFVARQ